MVNYSCENCGKEFNQKGNYTKHLNKKNNCVVESKVKEIVEIVDKVEIVEIVDKVVEEKMKQLSVSNNDEMDLTQLSKKILLDRIPLLSISKSKMLFFSNFFPPNFDNFVELV